VKPAHIRTDPGGLLLLLIRHAEQQTTKVADPPLSARGEVQARLLAERLAALPITAIVSSPLARARQTAEALAGLTGIPIQVNRELEEIRASTQQLGRRIGVESPMASLEPSPLSYAIGAMAAVREVPRMEWPRQSGSETGPAFAARVSIAIDRVLEGRRAAVIACFTHGGVINMAIGAWIGANRDLWFVPWHTGVNAVFVAEDGPVLLGLNDVAHLGPAEALLEVVSAAVQPDSTFRQ
jgi:broad specificity phosphatase PhoE